MEIAFFNYWWPYLVYTDDLINSFVGKGHTVHLFMMDTWFSHVKKPEPHSQLHLHTFELSGDNKNALDALVRIKLDSVGKKNIEKDSVEYLSAKLMRMLLFMAEFAVERAPKVTLGLGMEKGGLLWANSWHKKCKAPYLFYCTELFSADSTVFNWLPVAAMLPFEPAAHASAAGTIIQDQDRANYLCHYNRVSPNNFFYFPVSSKAIEHTPRQSHSNYKICMYFGSCDGRFNEEDILTLHRVLPEDYIAYFHMNNRQPFLHDLKQRYGMPNIRVSTSDLDASGINALIAKARVGLCWYHPDDFNHALTAFSSEKLARYLSLGLPVIVNANSNFNKLFTKFRCGEALHAITELPDALSKIEANYEEYSSEASRAFAALYNHDNNFECLYAGLIKSGLVRE